MCVCLFVSVCEMFGMNCKCTSNKMTMFLDLCCHFVCMLYLFCFKCVLLLLCLSKNMKFVCFARIHVAFVLKVFTFKSMFINFFVVVFFASFFCPFNSSHVQIFYVQAFVRVIHHSACFLKKKNVFKLKEENKMKMFVSLSNAYFVCLF